MPLIPSFCLSARWMSVKLQHGVLSPYGKNSSRLSGSFCQGSNLSFKVKALVLLLAPLDYTYYRASKTVKGRRKPNAVLPLTGLRERCILSYAVQIMLLLLPVFLYRSSSFVDRRLCLSSISHKISVLTYYSKQLGIAFSSRLFLSW